MYMDRNMVNLNSSRPVKTEIGSHPFCPRRLVAHFISIKGNKGNVYDSMHVLILHILMMIVDEYFIDH